MSASWWLPFIDMGHNWMEDMDIMMCVNLLTVLLIDIISIESPFLPLSYAPLSPCLLVLSSNWKILWFLFLTIPFIMYKLQPILPCTECMLLRFLVIVLLAQLNASMPATETDSSSFLLFLYSSSLSMIASASVLESITSSSLVAGLPPRILSITSVYIHTWWLFPVCLFLSFTLWYSPHRFLTCSHHYSIVMPCIHHFLQYLS